MDPNKNKFRRRLRRKRHIRKRVSGSAERPRLSVTRSIRHIYVQVIDDHRGVTLCSASTMSPEVRDDIGGNGGNRSAAERVGGLLGRRIKDLGIDKLAFDRNGYRFHGRIAALKEAVRKEGIEV